MSLKTTNPKSEKVYLYLEKKLEVSRMSHNTIRLELYCVTMLIFF